MDHHHKEKLRTYMEDLEEERRKIQVFRRELPLCLELVSQAIDTCKKQLSEADSIRKRDTNLDQLEQITTTSMECRPRVLEEMEFIPIRSSSSPHVDEIDDTNDEHHSCREIDNEYKKMSEWLRSASLWNPSPDNMCIQLKESDQVSLPEEKERNSDGGASPPPLERGKTAGRINLSPDTAVESVPPPESAATTSSMADAGARRTSAGSCSGACSKTSAAEKEERSKRKKQRRNWSPELQRSFVHALQQLGGSYVATPKQIRELMKVDGLTNDEIKSHLQKYRIYNTRRQISPAAAQSRGNYIQQQPQTTQLVFIGSGIWIPPPSVLTETPLV